MDESRERVSELQRDLVCSESRLREADERIDDLNTKVLNIASTSSTAPYTSSLFCFQLQELQLTANQADLDFKSDLADKEELISKLNSELRVLDERLGHQEGAVSEVFEVKVVTRVKKPS